mgnify:FL=1|jgi:hypothetical protein
MKKNKNSNNWQKAKNKIHQKKYSLPEGWDSRDVVSDQLKCDPSKVSKILSFGIESGDILCKQFYVWDQVRGRAVNKTFYKENFNHQEDSAKCFCESSPSDKKVFHTELNGPVKRVYSRHRKIQGTLYQDKTVTWDNGKISFPSASSWKKRDIYIVS